MIFELTLIANFTLTHLIVGLSLCGALAMAFRWVTVSAELQSWLWTTAFVMTTLIPFTAFVAMPTDISSPEVTIASSTTINDAADSMQPVSPAKGNEQAARPLALDKPLWHLPAAFVSQFQWFFYLFLSVWVIGSIRRTRQIVQSVWRTRCMITTATPLQTEGQLNSIGPYPLLQSTTIKAPVAVGLISPAVVLPASLVARFSAQQLVPIILHELAHISRRDLWTGLFQETLAIVFWWSPLMRFLNYRIHITRELACDMRAASQMASGKNYAQSLLDCAQLMVAEHSNTLAMGLFANKKELNDRIHQVLHHQKTKAPNTLKTTIVCLGLVFGTVGVAQAYMPTISLAAIQKEANFFSNLSRAKGEILLEAVRKKDRADILAMIENGLDINTPIIGDGTALMVAVRYGHTDMVTWLLQQGADVNQAARGDGNPLIIAAKSDNRAMVELLLANGANIDAIVPGDETALINASWRGHMALVRYLVGQGANVNLGAETFDYGSDRVRVRTPLNMAKNPAVRDYLISAGATE